MAGKVLEKVSQSEIRRRIKNYGIFTPDVSFINRVQIHLKVDCCLLSNHLKESIMGRKSKNKKRHKDHTDQNKKRRPAKRQKRERFWIEDCRDTSLPPSSSPNVERASLEVLITQCQLFDDYRQIPRKRNECVDDKPADTLPEISKDGSTETEKSTVDGKDEEAATKAIMQELPTKKETCDKSGDQKPDESKNENEATAVSKEPTKTNFSDAFISIKRSRSALKPITRMENSVEDFQPLPNGDCGDGITNPHDKEEVPDKFWSQRRRLFTLFDEGIRLDKESWYSVTPEAIANHISAHLVGNREDAVILDPFCGCGGNAIAFAKMERVKLVVCVDKDLEKLKMAASNAGVYGIPKEKMVFIHNNAGRVLSFYDGGKLTNGSSDCETNGNKDVTESFKIGGIELLPETIDCIFLSPPWGGMDYAKVGKRNYTLQCIKVDGIEEHSEMDGEDILIGAAKALGEDGPIALFLPKNINGVALGRSALRAGYSCPLVLEKNVLNGKLKTVTAYIGS